VCPADRGQDPLGIRRETLRVDVVHPELHDDHVRDREERFGRCDPTRGAAADDRIHGHAPIRKTRHDVGLAAVQDRVAEQERGRRVRE